MYAHANGALGTVPVAVVPGRGVIVGPEPAPTATVVVAPKTLEGAAYPTVTVTVAVEPPAAAPPPAAMVLAIVCVAPPIVVAAATLPIVPVQTAPFGQQAGRPAKSVVQWVLGWQQTLLEQEV